MPPPQYLYKILDQDPGSPFPETLPSTELDSKDGFIHLSTQEQTPITAKLFFADRNKLWLLMIESNALDGELKFSTDPAAGVPDGCAHLHGSKLGLTDKNVKEVIEVEKEDAMEWTHVPAIIDPKSFAR